MYKTTITVTVLSEEPYEFNDLISTGEDICYHDCVGRIVCEKSTEITDEQMKRELLEAGSEESFFFPEDDELD